MATAHTGIILRQVERLFGAGSIAGLSDAQLVGRFWTHRDEAAFEALVARHGPMVLAVCRGILRDEHAAEDAFQATFLILVRKAGALWVGESLGGWLHRVAYRVALQARADAARRRAREKRAGEAAALKAARVGPEYELRALLHAEISRLPDRLRLPVVLCDLEGLTRDQAAERLRWTEGMVRGRLARARGLLRQRLTRRGVVLPAGVLAAVLAREASAAIVSEVLLATTSRSAMGKGTGSAVAALAARVIQAMFAAKLKAAAAIALGVVALVSAGWFLTAGKTEEDGPPAPVTRVAAQPEDRPGASVEVRGRVVDPGGRPVAGATLRLAELPTIDPQIPQAMSGPDGRYLMRIPLAIQDSALVYGADAMFVVIGSAHGFGPGWIPPVSLKAATAGELTVRLVEDGPPIEGRIVDLEGRPVAGAQVRVEQVWFDGDARPPFTETGDLSAWIEKVKDRGVQSGGLVPLETTMATTTGDDGRFRLAGVGRERVAELIISGPTIVRSTIYAMSRNGPEVRCIDQSAGKAKPVVFHAPQFVDAVAPTRPIEGVVRDQATGKPIAGLTLHAAVFREHDLNPAEGVEAITDRQGHYRLSGLPKAPAYRLFVEQSAGLPYPRSTFRAPADSPTLEPVRFDIALKRGILIRGRVTDKATGKPVPGELNAFVFRDNPFINEFPGFVVNDFAHDIVIKGDGRYEAVALPGRNIIACRSLRSRYRCGVGAEAITGYDPNLILFRTQPLDCYFRSWHVLAEQNLDPETESANLDLQVDPGRSLSVSVVDPEGNPLGGTTARGIGDSDSTIEYPQESPTIEIQALDPSTPRRVTITHAARKLIGSVYLEGDETGPVTVPLQPWGTITGRLADDKGKPRRNLAPGSAESPPVRFDVEGNLPAGHVNNHFLIDSDGRFRVEGLVPGLKYGASETGKPMHNGTLFQDVTVDPGEVKDLGDLRVLPRKENPL